MLVEKVCLRANESTYTYTFELQLQMPDIISHRAVIVDLMTADGEMRLRECERARMRAKVMTWNACAAVRVESGGLESLVWDETHVTPSTKRSLILRSTHVAEQGCLDVVAIEGGFVRGIWGS
jgi:hypothetical protein